MVAVSPAKWARKNVVVSGSQICVAHMVRAMRVVRVFEWILSVF
ncbi:hypothetical protein BIFGAL_03231 [Bifidobacterium gallicum DSM 20093 = LMG 11596]|uniref:Uncharacterized protein n=1 Tax=Bifidobacterium gallicum DSM 20093 = LMG 11596 TaxID=561180 RepID=D1NTR5_9BIFI|nr:hypothetical protein BIFGAL_03231 [Bifidobacterium gallicum DSM 20093 = LMG 11596]